MDINTTQKTHFVPAICTRCGAALDVDPNQDAAVCPYCDTAFIVEKAINNYNIQNAHIDKIEHVDNLTVDMKGSVDSLLGFASEQMKEGRKEWAERRREESARSREFMKMFFKMFLIIFVIMIAVWIVMTVTGMWA